MGDFLKLISIWGILVIKYVKSHKVLIQFLSHSNTVSGEGLTTEVTMVSPQGAFPLVRL